MDIMALQGMDLLSLAWNEQGLDIRAVDAAGARYQGHLSNLDHSPIEVAVHWTHFRLVSEQGKLTLGEIERIDITDGRVDINMDSGRFSVRASKRFCQKLQCSAQEVGTNSFRSGAQTLAK